MGEGWQLLKIRGIPLRIHASWFVILALASVAFQQQYSQQLASQTSGALLWILGFGTALLLFVSVLLHELGHSIAAISQGVKVRSITLFMLGGVASVERECSTAMGSLLVAAAGPLVSLALAGLLLGSTHSAAHVSPLLGTMVKELGGLNLILALFNLLPGLPLDGGLILKALVWQWTGSQRKGIQVATTSGKLLSLLAIGLGAVLLLRGGSVGGLWLMVLGWFGLGAARNQTQLLALQSTLRELKVKDAAQRRFRVLEARSSLRELSRLRLQEGTGPADWLLVCDGGRWQGVINDAPLQALPVQRWDGERIGDHLQPLTSLPSIHDDAPLWQAVIQLDDGNTNRLLVLSPAGLPCGTLERPELAEAVLAKLGVKLPAPILEAARREGVYPLGMGLAPVARAMLASGEVQGQELSNSAAVAR
ncbi:site-2 protease family protein [Synechococcus sp. HJ21-Hayes]|uniref:site-2 protease family protein n=1 Tax=unclassified Synechococcus TaxID=2626047 RepID=UPI0020CBA4B2|nr:MULTISPECIES: site-2 protease family protein [unclassified Synechococcus]MCP9830257.1 site-2 protease family protein [Synechococcus sp. JJ3a-Johnson]MCP9851764.1 site-2 protease family protein [Synechococcus sp. HJ21-Hayes]